MENSTAGVGEGESPERKRRIKEKGRTRDGSFGLPTDERARGHMRDYEKFDNNLCLESNRERKEVIEGGRLQKK